MGMTYTAFSLACMLSLLQSKQCDQISSVEGAILYVYMVHVAVSGEVQAILLTLFGLQICCCQNQPPAPAIKIT